MKPLYAGNNILLPILSHDKISNFTIHCCIVHIFLKEKRPNNQQPNPKTNPKQTQQTP